MRNVEIVILQTGHTSEPIRSLFGEFPQFFERALVAYTNLGPYKLTVYDLCHDWPQKPLPDLALVDGVLVTGSRHMLDENAPWMLGGIDFIKQCLDKEVPFLGVCFGHQMLGAACGSKVGPNPNKRAMGTVEVTPCGSTNALLQDLEKPFLAQVSHRDVILEKSPSFQVLATAPHDNFHVIKAGSCAYGVQFHPEWDMEIVKTYIEQRRDVLENELGEKSTERLLANLQDSPLSSKVLARFIEMCRKKT